MNGRTHALAAAALTLGTQLLLGLVAVASWLLIGDDGARAAGKWMAGLAGAVCLFAALALFVPLAAALRAAVRGRALGR